MKNMLLIVGVSIFLFGCANYNTSFNTVIPPHPSKDINMTSGESEIGNFDDPEVLSDGVDGKRVLFRVFDGDTISGILERSSVKSNILSLLDHNEKKLLTNIHPKDVIEMTTDNDGNLIRLAKTIKGSENSWSVFKKVGNKYELSKQDIKATYNKRYVQGKVKYNLYETGRKLDIDQSVIRKMTDILKNQINLDKKSFQGDTFKIIYCQMKMDGSSVGEPVIMAVEYFQKGKTYSAYRFKNNNGFIYYDEYGKDLKNGFLKEPLKYNTITSNFSKKRWHPVLNKYREHHGVDFSAPEGTEIVSPSRGKVTFIGKKGGYGNVIEIEHGNSIKTLYGHLSNFKGGLRKGDIVNQGDVIAYVGSTGTSTGPHLHYEFIKDDKPVDPLLVNITSVENLDGLDLVEFKKSISYLKREMIGIKEMDSDRMLSFEMDFEKDDGLM